MATSAPKPAKAGPQPVPDAPPVEEEVAPPKKSKGKLFIIIGAALLILIGSGIGAWLAPPFHLRLIRPFQRRKGFGIRQVA